MRCFLALAVPAPMKRQLDTLQKALQTPGLPAVWTKATAMHLTLRFMGDISESDLARLQELGPSYFAAEERCLLRAAGVGVFPNRKRPVVLWAGLTVERGDLRRLQAQAEALAQELGIPGDKKPFHPHITLARLKTRPWKTAYAAPLRQLQQRMQDQERFEGTPFEATAVGLYSSELRPEGARHKRLVEFPLQ